jgi:hypothetical protein
MYIDHIPTGVLILDEMANRNMLGLAFFHQLPDTLQVSGMVVKYFLKFIFT